MQQILVVHGGTTFENYEQFFRYLLTKEFSLERLGQKDWKSSLQKELGEAYQIIAPGMPNSWNARYAEWEVWFGKVLAAAGNDLILVGHSLGGIFLAKYLSMHDLGKTIRATILVAPVFESSEIEVVGDFELPASLEKFSAQAGTIHIFHSEDDPVVPYAHAEKYRDLLPSATLHTFSDRQHFNQSDFPEIIETIRSL